MGERIFKPRHKSTSFKPKREHNPERDRKQAFYNGNDDWRKYRERFLEVNPECYACGEKATVVDHVIPFKGDVVLFEKLDNHIPLCEYCHNYVSARFDSKFVVGGNNHDKIRWLNQKRIPTETWTPKKVKVIGSYRDPK